MKLVLAMFLMASVSAQAAAPECGQVVRLDQPSSKAGAFKSFMVATEATGNVSGIFDLGISTDFAKNLADIQLATTAYQSNTLLCRCEMKDSMNSKGGADQRYFVAREAKFVSDCK